MSAEEDQDSRLELLGERSSERDKVDFLGVENSVKSENVQQRRVLLEAETGLGLQLLYCCSQPFLLPNKNLTNQFSSAVWPELY